MYSSSRAAATTALHARASMIYLRIGRDGTRRASYSVISLGGTKVRSLDLAHFLEDHADAFVRAYAAGTPSRRPPAKRRRPRLRARQRRR
jgi:hypothetical protein